MRLFQSALIAAASALQFRVSHQNQLCLTYSAKANAKVSILYHVVEEDHESRVDFRLSSFQLRPGEKLFSAHETLHKSLNNSSSHETKLESGNPRTYKLCFKAAQSSEPHIGLYINDTTTQSALASVDQTQSLALALQEVSEEAINLQNSQELSNFKERSHLSGLKAAYHRVKIQKWLQSFAYIAITAAHVYFIEQLFQHGKRIL